MALFPAAKLRNCPQTVKKIGTDGDGRGYQEHSPVRIGLEYRRSFAEEMKIPLHIDCPALLHSVIAPVRCYELDSVTYFIPLFLRHSV
jgi:hypothetical protein